jgi:hypothetical protein
MAMEGTRLREQFGRPAHEYLLLSLCGNEPGSGPAGTRIGTRKSDNQHNDLSTDQPPNAAWAILFDSGEGRSLGDASGECMADVKVRVTTVDIRIRD